MARRIVPELISPTQASAVHPAFEAAAEQVPVLRFNLKEQAELAKSLLEPGRKLYVDISQESKVNWRKLQHAAGVQKRKPQHKAALALPLDRSSVPQAPLPMGGGSNIFASVVERLASGLTMQRLEPDSDDSSSEAGEPRAHSGPESEGESDASGHHSDYYENDDGFIDDTEVHEFFGGDWHKPKHSGFYINHGDIEKTDEMLLSDDPEPKKKKKLKPKQGQLGSPPQREFQVREVMGKDGRMKKVRRRVQGDAHATPLAKKAKPSKEGPGAKSPKPARRQAAATAPHAAAAAPAQAMPWSPDPAQRLPPWETPKPCAPQTAAPNSSAAAAPQPGPTPEEDRISLAALAAGATPAKAPKAVTESLPASPAVGPPPVPSAPARTPLTGKKRSREGTEGGTGYEMPPDVKQLLDQLKAQAEALGLPRDVKDPSDELPPAGEEKAPKKLPPQLNPLLAKLARAAARENVQHSGARTVIANAAYSFLHPWSHKGNMAVRLKKLHESAQARYDKAREGLIEAVAKQPKALAGVLQAEAKLIGSDDDFAALPSATASQLTTPAASASGPAAAAAAGSSGMVWDKPQASALHSFVVSLLDLQGGRDDNQSMWEDVASKSDLWGTYKPTAAELRHVYDQNKSLYSQADGEVQPRKRARRARPPAGSTDRDPPGRASGTLGIVGSADGTSTLHQHGAQEILPFPTQTSSESPSLSPQPPQPQPSSTLAAGAGAPLSAATTSASQLSLQQKPTEEQLAAGQNTMQEQRPQLRTLGGGALIAAAEMQGGEATNMAQSLTQPAGALLPYALTAARAHAPAAGALVAQPSDGLSHALQPSQGSLGGVEKPSGALTSHPSGEGEGALAPGAPTKEEFLQYGVENGGDRNTLEQGFTSCRRGSVKDITYKILLRAGPQGLRVAQILDAACNMGVVKENWAENRASRASQISNAMRNTKLFVHVGDHRYAIARFPGVQLIPLKPAPGKNSGEKAAIAEGTDRKTAGAPSTTSRQESDAGSLARAGSTLESHNSHVASMAAAPSNTSMAPILPLPAQLSLFTGPPVLTAALNQAIGQSQPQQPPLPSQPHMQSMQSLLQDDEPVRQTEPHSYQHTSPSVQQE